MERMLTVRDIMGYLSISRATVLRLIWGNHFPNAVRTTKKGSGSWRIPKNDFDNHLEALRTNKKEAVGE